MRKCVCVCVCVFFKLSLFRGSHAFKNGTSVFGLCIVKYAGPIFSKIFTILVIHKKMCFVPSF